MIHILGKSWEILSLNNYCIDLNRGSILIQKKYSTVDRKYGSIPMNTDNLKSIIDKMDFHQKSGRKKGFRLNDLT